MLEDFLNGNCCRVVPPRLELSVSPQNPDRRLPDRTVTLSTVWRWLTWQKQLWSWLSGVLLGCSLCCVLGFALFCWNQPRTKFPRNQAISRTANACKVTFHIPHGAAGAPVAEQNRARNSRTPVRAACAAVWRTGSYGSFRLAEVSIRRLTVAVELGAGRWTEQPGVRRPSHGQLDLGLP